MKGETSVTRRIIDKLQSCDIQGDKIEGKTVLLEVSLMNFNLGIFK